jgi:choline dehydrogenase
MGPSNRQTIPPYADVVVLGGGTAGSVVAGRLAARGDRSVLVLEAGPDYGPYDAGGWPEPLLDARVLPPPSHDWEYTSAAHHGTENMRLDRARVLGGCSSHNGCAAIWGSRVDYDGWTRLGNPGWGADDLLPFFRMAAERLRVRNPGPEEITPWQQAFLDAAPGIGVPRVADLNNLDEDIGIAPSPVNIWHGVRWNTAFAYLDPVRDSPNLTIRGDVLADRLIVQGTRIRAVEVLGPDGPARVEARQVVLSGGAYGSPAILLRSGIGDPDELRALGIAPVHALPGVGRNLQDHPAVNLFFTGTPALLNAMQAFVDAGSWLPDEQTIAKAHSSHCRQAFDLHLYPTGSTYWSDDGSWRFMLPVANMTPRSRGSLRLSSVEPAGPPLIDHAYLSDPEGLDLAILLDGVDLARSLVAQQPLARLIERETTPGPDLMDRAELRAYILRYGVHYYHPVGTCKMGPAGDPEAVVDARGQVHGIEGLFVADASIMPVIPRANTNVPCVVIGEKIAARLDEG